MYPFSGQMHLCDFGDKMGTLGPGGTPITPTNVYSFSDWSVRNYVKASLKALFPHKAPEIDEKIVPGEYGVEDSKCRLVCCLLFIFAMVQELRESWGIFRLLYNLPTPDEGVKNHGLWVQYKDDDYCSDKIAEMSDLKKQVEYRIAGIPKEWKIVNFVFILLPKVLLWWCLTSAGFRWLMDTANIVSLIVNAMAMTFIISIDEMILAQLGTVATRYMMSELQDYTVQREIDPNEEEDDYPLAKTVVPWKLLFILLVFGLFVFKYYFLNCRLQDGMNVSNDVHLPKMSDLSILRLLFGYIPVQED